jgi:hypothetical protein
MKLIRQRGLLLAVAILFVLAAGVAAAQDIPLKNWTPVPMAAGRTALLTDIGTGPILFVPVTPCRIIDTRGGAPFTGGPFAAAASRDYQFSSAVAPCNGLPAGARGFSINVAVTNTAGPGFLSIYPRAGQPSPLVASINYAAGQTIANAASVPTDASGFITILCGVSGTDVIVDVNGYYIGGAGTGMTPGKAVEIRGNTDPSIYGLLFSQNFSTRAADTNVAAVRGYIANSPNGTGVAGVQASGTGANFGVRGENSSTTNGAAGVYGQSSGATGVISGVLGSASSTTSGAAAVKGEVNGSFPVQFGGRIGVQGNDVSGGGFGVLGLSENRGVQGSRVNATGVFQNGGVLGYAGTSGVHSFQDITAGGLKPFVEPHPIDPARQVVFVAMEGPEAGTYFRGRGRFEGRTAVIVVPESFRLVTEEEGLTVQITPIGRAAAVGVVSMGLNQIVVESTRDVEFSYLVQGVRHHYGRFEAIQPNTYFVPASADARMEPWPEHIQKQLIDLGIYRPDGTVNMNTAEKMGWAQKWRDEEKARADAAREPLNEAKPGQGENGQ